MVTINKSFEYFLTAAEELNFTKASKKHYISQQAFSQHIKKLEEDYKTVLFERTPYVRLTDEGRVFLEYVKAQKILDESLKKRLYEMGKGKRGKFSFGINASRSRIVLPEILKEYSENFPNVDISVYLNDTKDMEEMVIDGKLDLFMGINTKRKEELDIKSICFDSVYMVMSVATIEKIFGDESKAFIENSKDGVEMNKIDELNFILNLSKSTTTDALVELLNNRNISFENRISISDYDTQFEVCKNQKIATVAPSMMLKRIIEINKLSDPKEFLCAFPIKELRKSLEIALVKHINFIEPSYIKDFSHRLEEFVRYSCSKYDNYIIVPANL